MGMWEEDGGGARVSEVDLKQCRRRVEGKTRVEEQRPKKKHANAQRSEEQLGKDVEPRVYRVAMIFRSIFFFFSRF